MNKEFKREERYIVVKIKDAQTIDSNDPFNGEHALRDFLKQWHIPIREAVVVEKDWPEYEPTWAAIERRVTGAQWNGEGLPPAGTVCELRMTAAGSDWARAEIKFASRNVIVWDWEGESPINGLCTGYIHTVQLRPIRTPEQIEAEEREKAASAIADLMKATRFGLVSTDVSPKEMARAYAEAIYDAGYRKQVAP